MLNFTGKLTFPSMLSYAAWRFSPQFPCVDLKLRSGTRIELRRDDFGNNDLGIAHEVFSLDWYNTRGHLKPDEIKLVVDLGANIGFSILHWLDQFPHCRVIAFEPNPKLVPQVQRNLALNHVQGRVELHQAAAGASTRMMMLTDAGSSSRLTENGSLTGHSVEVLDVFEILAGKTIDLLKIDIEGGEYEILDDPRFDGLDVRAIAMEWHARTDPKADKQWCEDRLTKLGFKLDEIFAEPTYGMFWAIR
jgi:FkbM family methyltransferase